MRTVSLNSKTTVRAKVAKTEEMVFAIMQEVLFFSKEILMNTVKYC